MAASTPAAEDHRPMAGAVPPQQTRVNLKALLEAHVVSLSLAIGWLKSNMLNTYGSPNPTLTHAISGRMFPSIGYTLFIQP